MRSLLSQASNSDNAVSSLPWDRLCDLLGGADWSLINKPDHSPLAIDARFNRGRQFLFQDDPARLPLESLWLKLSGFACLCRQVAAFYQQHRRPHLSLDPRHIHVRVSDHTFTWLPARWLFAVELDAEKGATTLVHDTMPTEMVRNVFVPSADRNSPYAAPIMNQWPMGRELSVTILLRSLERVPDDTEHVCRALVRVHVFSETASFADFSENDVFHLVLRLPGNTSPTVALWARRVGEAERGLVVSGVTEPIPTATWTLLQRSKQQVFSDARATIYRAFHHAGDLYSLGMLLFHGLLVNQHQSLEKVRHQVATVLNGLEPLVQGLHPDDHWTLFKRVTGRLQEQQGIFNPPAEISVPEYLWWDTLILALRLVSWIPGFSFCDSHGATDETLVPEALRRTVHMAELLAEEARIDLFDASARHHELERLCNLVLTQRL